MLSASSLTGSASSLTGSASSLTGSASALTGGVSGLTGASNLTYKSLQDKYLDFGHPRAAVELGGTTFSSEGNDIIVGEIQVEITSGYEASVATFRLYDVFDPYTGNFRYSNVGKQVLLGNSVSIYMGYLSAVEKVFVGFISGVAFGYDEGDLPYIEVSAMDVKGLMMGGSYARQLTATTYGAAVKEILTRTGDGKIQSLGGVTAISVSKTPDEPDVGIPAGAEMPKSSPITVEMVGESDYEFVVRAAKRYNYEFFVDRGAVLFRPMKSNTALLMTMGVREGIRTFRVEYSLTSVVGEIEARAMDPGKGKVISVNSKFNNTISTGSKAKQLMGKGAKVYLDASITSQEEAQARVNSLMEQMSYRLGSLDADCVGIPDLVPGRFIKLAGLGTPVDNQFYITSVTHSFSGDNGFTTHIIGCANQVQTAMGMGGVSGGVGSGLSLAGGAAGNLGSAAGGIGGLL